MESMILGFPVVPKSPTTSADLIVTQPRETIGALKNVVASGAPGQEMGQQVMQNDKLNSTSVDEL